MALDKSQHIPTPVEGGADASTAIEVHEGMLCNPHSPFVQFERRIGELVRNWVARKKPMDKE